MFPNFQVIFDYLSCKYRQEGSFPTFGVGFSQLADLTEGGNPLLKISCFPLAYVRLATSVNSVNVGVTFSIEALVTYSFPRGATDLTKAINKANLLYRQTSEVLR